MENVVITLQTGHHDHTDLEVPLGIPLGTWLPPTLKTLGWAENVGEQFALAVPSRGTTLRPSDTLDARGIVDGEVLVLRLDSDDTGQDLRLASLSGENRRFAIGKHALIGRPNPRQDVHVDVDLTDLDSDKSISRPHAEIRYQGGIYRLTDLGSRNGTFLNDRPLEANRSYDLTPGDRIRFGRSGPELTFQVSR